MKKTIFVVLFLILFSPFCFAAPDPEPSGEKTADASISSVAGYYYGMVVTTDGTNACTVKIYDNATTNANKVIDSGVCPGASYTCKYLFPFPVPTKFGIYADMTTVGTCTYIIYGR